MAILNRAEYVRLRQMLRRNRSEPERHLWRYLRGGQIGYRFRTQYGIGKYVVDFCCPQLKLAIEVDGGQHNEPGARRYDAVRQEYIETLGFTVRRYTTLEVMQNTATVLNDIVGTCNDLAAG